MESHSMMGGEALGSVINMWAVVAAAVVSVLGLGLVSSGVVAARRSFDPLARAIAWAAAVAGALLLLTLGLTIWLDTHPPVLMPAFFMVLGPLALAFWALSLVHCVTRESDQGNNRLIWVIIIVLTHVIGAALYWLVRRPRREADPQA